MNIKHVFFVFTAFALLTFGCDKSNDPQPADDPQPQGVDFSCDDNPITCDLTDANGLFALDLFKKINEDDPDGNVFISPFSISTALTMTTNGADSQTLEDMRNVLKISNMGMSSVNDSYQQLLEALPALDPETKLKLANSIWPQIDYPVLESFLDINTEYFNSEVKPVDFDDPNVIEKVNKWVEENTDGLIKETLKELPADVVMLLINAIYFKGAWRLPFDPEHTHEANFYTNSGAEKVDMMFLADQTFPYFFNDVFQAIDLPYGDSVFSMSVFLPREGHDVENIIAELNEDNWNNWMESFIPQRISLYLPKFKMEYELKMKEALQDMGMGLAFSDAADFTKMIDGGGVKIDEVIHKAFIEVNEEGTEAAAVTVVVIIENSAGNVFNVNRPFVFVIRDNKTNSILFMGKMMDPTS